MCATLLDAGCDVLALGDTTGIAATPGQVARYLDALIAACGHDTLAAHFHDTRGMALANTVVALQHGIHEFDASLAGLGGCPHAPGATGNVATEDLVFMLAQHGLPKRVSTLEHLLAVAPACSRTRSPARATVRFSLVRAGLPKGLCGGSNERDSEGEWHDFAN